MVERPLSGRRALVTGGSRGIGRAIAAALTGAGAEVAILGRSRASLDAALAAGVASRAEVADIADRAGLESALARIAGQGPVDILVSNAGAAASGPFVKQGLAPFDAMLAQHVLAPVQAAQLLLPGMVERRSGRIITIASTAAMLGYSHMTAYVAAKHAVLGFTRALALEVARTGVTVNAVCPGFTETEMLMEGLSARAAKAGRPADEVAAEFAGTKPLGRLVKPEEVAAAVLWLASDAAASVTGQAIVIDGGESVA